MKKKIAKALLVLLGLMVIAALIPLRQVADDDMAHSIRKGDWVWILPLRVLPADVVLLEDPLDPGRTVLRRAVAGTDKKVKYEESSFKVNGKKVRQTEMGLVGTYRVLKEVIWSRPPARANPFFIRQSQDPVKWSMAEKVEVPEGSWFLLADDRDHAIDSRWWGPVSEDRIKGVVRAQLAMQPDEWIPRFRFVIPEE